MDRGAVVARFRELYREHLKGGGARGLPHYLRLFAGFEDAIRAEFERLQKEAGPRPEEATPPGLGAVEVGESPPSRLGPYRLLRELGRGGQGQVFLAEDSRLQGRRVALKVLGSAFHSGHIERFRREAIAASRLDHPGICTVYEAGEIDGTHFIAMRFVEGRSLAHIIDESKKAQGGEANLSASSLAGPRSRGQLFDSLHAIEKAAHALHEAHEAGLVHRDVKPGNIMVDSADNPVLLDFGLAHDARDEDMALTRTGDLLGTPVYMSPEQLRGEPLDRRTDVYSLGATLYECLTLRRPFEAPTLDRLLMEVQYATPPRASSLNPHVPRDVDVVLATALDKDRNRRYQTALELAEELGRVRSLRPIRARPIGYGLRLGRWVQRNPWIAGLSGAVLFVLVAGLIASLLLLSRLSDEQDQTQNALMRAQSVGLSRAAVQALERDTGLALLLARRAVEVEPNPEAVGALYAALPEAREALQLRGHAHGVRDATFSPDESLVVTASLDGTARLWRIDGTPLATLRHKQDLTGVSFAPGGDAILTSSWDGWACLWGLDGTKQVSFSGHEKCVNHARFSADGAMVLTACFDGAARLFRTDGTLIGKFLHDGYPCNDAVLSPDATAVLTSGFDGCVRLFRADAPEPVWKLPMKAGIASIAFAPDGTSILVAPRKNVATLHGRDGSIRARFPHTRELIHAEFAPDGKHVITAAMDNVVSIWTLAGEAVCVLPHRTKLFAAAFAPDGRSVFTVAEDNVARVWGTFSGRLRMSLRGHSERIRSIRSTRAVDRILTSADDVTVRIWDVRVPQAPTIEQVNGTTAVAFDPAGAFATATGAPWIRLWSAGGEPLGHARHELGLAQSLAYSRDGTVLAGGGDRARIHLWTSSDDPGRQLEWTPDGNGQNQRAATDLAFSADGTRLVVACSDLHVRLFRTNDRKEIGRFHHGADVQLAEFVDSDRAFVSACRDGSVLRWDPTTAASRPLIRHDRGVTALEVRGEVVMTASRDGIVRLQSSDGRLLRELVHDREVLAAALSPTRDRIATATGRIVRLWSGAGDLLAAFPAHEAPVSALRFSPDGKTLLTAATDGSARLWPADLIELLRRARERTTRDFTPGERATYAALLPAEAPDIEGR